MYGGPSHVDLFDPKPELTKYNGKAIPVFKPEDAFMGAKTKNIAMKSPYKFARHGSRDRDFGEVPGTGEARRRIVRHPQPALREQ